MIKCIPLFLSLLVSCTPEGNDESKVPLVRLLEGNERYASSHPVHPHQSIKRLKELSAEQNPFAVVVSCSDSRLPPEIIFDQGLGDLFVIRTAGNVLGDYELASIEYAIRQTKCELVMILGHDGCGALKGVLELSEDSIPEQLNGLLNYFRKQPNFSSIKDTHIDPYYSLIINNILYGVDLLKKDLHDSSAKPANKEVQIVGGIYHLASGKVQIISDELD